MDGDKEKKPIDYSHFLREEQEKKEEITKKSSITSLGNLREAMNEPQKRNQVLIILFLVVIVIIIFVLGFPSN